MPQLHVILASTRPGRAGEPIADWFAARARAHGGFDVDLVDLADVGLPFFDEPAHPRLRRYEHDHTKAWSARIDAADAFVFVTAEYNHGYPATLKNAIDFLHTEWQYKPLGFVTYGGVAAGTRAQQQLKQVAGALKMWPLTEAVNIPFHTQFIDEDGAVQANEVMENAADAMLDELVAIEAALRGQREAVRSAA